MPLDPLVTAVVETSLNTLLRQDEQSQARLIRLKGKVLRVRFTDINKQLVFVFDKQISVLSAYEAEPDTELTLALMVLPKLKNKANLTALIKQEQLSLHGDLDLAQHFSQLLGNLNPNIAEWLSHYTGDVIAHTLVTGAKFGIAKLKSIGESQQRYVAELLVEEWRLTPGELEIAYFADRVDEVQSQVARLEARFERFETLWHAMEKGQVNDTN